MKGDGGSAGWAVIKVTGAAWASALPIEGARTPGEPTEPHIVGTRWGVTGAISGVRLRVWLILPRVRGRRVVIIAVLVAPIDHAGAVSVADIENLCGGETAVVPTVAPITEVTIRYIGPGQEQPGRARSIADIVVRRALVHVARLGRRSRIVVEVFVTILVQVVWFRGGRS